MGFLLWNRFATAVVVFSGVTAADMQAGKLAGKNSLADQLRKLDGRVVSVEDDTAKQIVRMLDKDAGEGIRAATERETKAWREVKTRADWERFRDARLQALRKSLGAFPPVPKDLHIRVVSELNGDGYRIKNLVFESRPGLSVTANLYLPADAPKSAAGVLICHSHHYPKSEGELQDMGMTWARSGCVVLVTDQLGHGERRQHPFIDAGSYPHMFRVSRQDYYFRYNVGIQLHLIGDSLMGWMVWDLMRGVDVLLAESGVDKDRIVLLGAVAGGGDPAAVTAALDTRIAVVAPFNFGGPQPETAFPLPANAEDSFNYVGYGSWESTRNLRLSARDGFLPWLIVGSVAPRGLIYGHEFSWDRERDPVWKRLEHIYGFYDAGKRLTAAAGKGRLSGKPPEATHCNNIGREQRKGIHAALNRWFDFPISEKEYLDHWKAEDLRCLTPDVLKVVTPRPLYEIAAVIGEERAAFGRRKATAQKPEEEKKRLREEWSKLLGDVESKREPNVLSKETTNIEGVDVHRVLLEVEPGIVVPLLVLVPIGKNKVRWPVVVGVAQQGKAELLKARAEVVSALLEAGVAVCLPDVRGTGETRSGGRGRQSTATSISSTELMLGQTLVGLRLRDLRSVLKYLRTREDLDAKSLALWGDSLASANSVARDLKVPLDADEQPDLAEPLGDLLALFGALYENDVKVIYARAGLTGYQSVLMSPFVYVAHDVIVPGALTTGDLCDVAAALAPRPVRLEALVDGLNRRVTAETLAKVYKPAKGAYGSAMAEEKLQLLAEPASATAAAKWLVDNLIK